MKVIWTPEAERDRDAVWAFIVGESPAAAAQMDLLFSKAAIRLSDFPRSGANGVVAGTRELIPDASYRLVYEIKDDTIWILALIHTARPWPPVSD